MTSVSATLTVSNAPAVPTIITQSTSQTVGTGHNVSFSMAVNAYPAPTCQWSVSTDGGVTWSPLQDNTNYAGTTTGTLTISNTTAAMNGYRYRGTATNASGSVNTNAPTLSVVVAIFPSPVGLAIGSSGAISVSDSSNNTIQVVNTAWQATALAGTAGQQGMSDGTGAGALFRQLGGLALNIAGNLFVADTGNSRIRRVTAARLVTTVAGSAANQSYRDGAGTAAWFNAPAAVALDLAGNLYVADTLNQTIRKITPAGVVSTLAGLAGISGSADGTGAGASFNQPRGLTVDAAGNVFVADTANSAIRKITPVGVVTTIAGLSTVAGFKDGVGIDAWLNQPRDVKVDALGNLYVADTGNAAIRKITPAGVVTTPVISAVSSTTPTPSPPSPSTDSSSDAPPPGKSGAGGFEGWFVFGLFALAMGRCRSFQCMRRYCINRQG